MSTAKVELSQVCGLNDNKQDHVDYNQRLLKLFNANDYVVKNAPPTVIYIPDFLTADEEQYLLAEIEQESDVKWLKDEEHRYQSFFNSQNMEKSVLDDPNAPEWIKLVGDRQLSVLNGYPKGFRPQVIQFHEYQPGQGIPIHRDDIDNERPIHSIVSLGSSALLDFYDSPKEETIDSSNCEELLIGSMLLKPRSLLLLSDEAKGLWHGVRSTTHDIITEKIFNPPTSMGIGTKIKREKRVSITNAWYVYVEIGGLHYHQEIGKN